METLLVVLFIVALTIVPMLSSIETRKLNRKIAVDNWIILKPTFSNSKSKVNSRMLLFLIGVFTMVFVLLNVLNII